MPLKADEEITPSVRSVCSRNHREKNLKEFQTTHDTDFAYELEGYGRFRANIFRDHKGWGVPPDPPEILTFEQLKLPQGAQSSASYKGLVLVTGPTGGKSTTLAAMIDYINKNRSDHIITIEDPIESA